MSREKYHETYLEEQFPAELREQLRADKLDPTRMPTYEYLNAKGFNTRGLSQAMKRHYGEEMTLHQFLSDHGFGHASEDGEWPTTHADTIELLNGYRDSRKRRNDDRDTTIATLESALRKSLRVIQDCHGTDNLLQFARWDTEADRFECNEQMETVIDTLQEELSDGAAGNYVRYVEEFYEYAEMRTRIDHNPVTAVKSQYDFGTTPDKDPRNLSDEQIQRLWETLKHLPNKDNRTCLPRGRNSRYSLSL